jgi:hypothetical protein
MKTEFIALLATPEKIAYVKNALLPYKRRNVIATGKNP